MLMRWDFWGGRSGLCFSAEGRLSMIRKRQSVVGFYVLLD